MAITNTWDIVRMDTYPSRDGLDHVAFTVHWTLRAEDENNNIGSAYGTASVSIDTEAEFTPYEDLTKDEVIKWVKDSLGQEQVTSLEENVANQIAEKVAPTIVTPSLPW